jgi:uncharacterized membrane protein YtjA (UPF0391 family)
MHRWGTRFLAMAAAEATLGWMGVVGAATSISWLLCVLFVLVALLSGRERQTVGRSDRPARRAALSAVGLARR